MSNVTCTPLRVASALLAGLLGVLVLPVWLATPAHAAPRKPSVTIRVAPTVAVNNATRYTYRVPAGVRTGDRMVVTFLLDDTTQRVSAPQGWQVLSFRSSADGHGETVLVTSLVRAAGQPSSFVFLKHATHGSTSFPLAVSTAAYAGVTTAKLSVYGSRTGTGVTSAPLPSIRGASGGLLLTFVGTRTTTSTPGIAPAAVEGVAGARGAAVGTNQWLGVATKHLASDKPTPVLGVTTTRAARMMSVEILLSSQAPPAGVRPGSFGRTVSPGSTNTVTVTTPSTVEPGDVQVVALGVQAENEAVAAVPAGWYPMTEATSGAGDARAAKTLVYAHVKAVGDPASYAWRKGSGPTGNTQGFFAMPVITFAVRGVSLPQLASYSITTGGVVDGTSAAPAATTGRRGGVLVEVSFSRASSYGTPVKTASPTLTSVGQADDGTSKTLAAFVAPITASGVDATRHPVSTTSPQGAAARASTGVVAFTLRPQTASASNLGWSSGINTELTTPAAVGEWRNRANDTLSAWPVRSSWSQVTDPRPAVDAYSANPARLTIGIAMLPNDDNSANLADCAKGLYADKMRTLATNLVGSVYPGGNRGDSILRIGWEFNTITDDSGVLGHSRSESRGHNRDWIGCWRQWYTQLKSIAPDLVIDWNPNCDTSSVAIPADPQTGDAAGDVTALYPGDAYVDIIGVDFYNRYPTVNNDAQWNAGYFAMDSEYAGTPRGIGAWLRFAQQHHKLLSFPEWAIAFKNPAGAGGTNDAGNAYWLTRMYQFFTDNAADIDHEVYFDFNGGFNCQFVLYPMPSACVNNAAALAYRGRW